MRLTLDPGDREILSQDLGLAANASDADLAAAITQRLTGPAPVPAVAQPPIASRQADGHDLIAAAVRDGRIPAQRADHYADRYARDPEGTAKLIAKMASVPAHVLDASSASAPADYPRSWLGEREAGRSRVMHE